MKNLTFFIMALLIVISQTQPYMPTLGCGPSADMNLAFIRVTYNFVEYSACLNSYDVVQDCSLFSINQNVAVYSLVSIGNIKCINCHNNEMFVAQTDTGVNSCIREIYSVPNCAKYRKTGASEDGWIAWACNQCSQGLRVNGVGTCSPIVNKCSSYTQYGWCTRCVTGYELKGSVCSQRAAETPLKVLNPDQGCLTQVEIGKCPKCKIGYVLVDKVCLSIKNNAEKIDKALGQCLPGELRFQSGKCAIQMINCQRYNEQGLCLNCKQGFLFSEDLTTCESISGPNVEELCLAEIEEGQKYILVKGECVKVDQKCVEGNEDGCINCEEGYFLYNKKCYFIDFEEILGEV